MDVSVIIVNYNTKQITLNCLKSIFEYTKDIEFEVILVDNASSDGSVEAIEKCYPMVQVIKSEVNLGFGRANNLGVEKAKGEFLFLLNSDTILLNNAIKEFWIFFKENELLLKIGVLGCMLKTEDLLDGPSYDYFVSPLDDILFLFHEKNKSRPSKTFHNGYFQVDWVSGADMFMRTDLFMKLKGFHDEFFLYSEEVDLQKRISKEGYLNYILEKPKIIHIWGASGRTDRPNIRKYIIVNQSKVIYVKNNYSFGVYVMFKCVFIFLSVLKMLLHPRFGVQEKLTYIKEMITWSMFSKYRKL